MSRLRGDTDRPETWKTCVVLLITQRSQVQILPPLLESLGQRPFPIMGGAFCMLVANGIFPPATTSCSPARTGQPVSLTLGGPSDDMLGRSRYCRLTRPGRGMGARMRGRAGDARPFCQVIGDPG